MPNMVVKLPAGVLDADAKHRLVAALNAVAVEAERIGDDPRNRFLCWVAIDEIAPGNWTCGGLDVSADAVPVMALIYLPAGVLDAGDRERYAAGVQEAFSAAMPGERRRILVSCLFQDVQDGHWGVTGRIWRLHDFARHAGFRHLRHLVEEP